MTVGVVLYNILSIYVYVLLGRIIIDYVMIFARSWTPRGFMLIVVDTVFRLTDPPLRFIRRFVPSIRLGSVSLDLSFLVLIIGIQILSFFVLAL